MELSKSTRNEIGMPLVGFGTYQLSIDQAEFCVKKALEAGFRHIDSAEGYNNEEGTGKGIKAAGISRDDIFVTTKLFPGYQQWGMPEKTYEQTIETLKNQLRYCVLTKSSKPERIRENLNLFDFEIPDNDMERLNRLNQNQAFAWAANGLNPMEVAPPLNKKG